MKNGVVRRQLIIAIILVLLISPSQSAQAYTGLHNATEKQDVTAWGARGYITWTNPNLNDGEWSYHRVVVFQQSPWRYVEWGWQKTKTELRGLIVYNDGSGDIMAPISSVSAATHRYSMQYDPNTSKYWFYLDGSNVYNIGLTQTSYE